MAKYIQLYREMRKNHSELFDRFKSIHNKYAEEDSKHQNEFNEIGEKVVEVIRDYELRLTSKAENGQFSKYSSNLADKFWERVRKDFPEIDFVGAKIS